jgi:hypothetical protein
MSKNYNNIFSFNDKTYVQAEGTAIGSRLGMSYACTYMGEWEAELFKRTKYQPCCSPVLCQLISKRLQLVI